MLEGIEIGDLNGKGMLSAAASDVEAPTPKSGSALHTYHLATIVYSQTSFWQQKSDSV